MFHHAFWQLQNNILVKKCLEMCQFTRIVITSVNVASFWKKIFVGAISTFVNLGPTCELWSAFTRELCRCVSQNALKMPYILRNYPQFCTKNNNSKSTATTTTRTKQQQKQYNNNNMVSSARSIALEGAFKLKLESAWLVTETGKFQYRIGQLTQLTNILQEYLFSLFL